MAGRPITGASVAALFITTLPASSRGTALGGRLPIIYAAAGINGQSVRIRGADQATVDDLERACVEFDALPLELWSPGRVKVGAIRAKAASMKSRQNLQMLVVDYSAWILPDDPRAPRRDQVGEVVKALRSIGQRLKIPVLLCHQLNRDSDGERPRLSHLRESGCVEEDADAVVFLDPVQVVAGSPEMANLIVEKNRQGARGQAPLFWHPEATRFSDSSEF